MPMGLNEGNIGRSVCPGFGKSTYGASLAKTSETILENKMRTKLIYFPLDTIVVRGSVKNKVTYFILCMDENKISEVFP